MVQSRNDLSGKYNENRLVLNELELLDKDASVYKLVGPILAKQDL